MIIPNKNIKLSYSLMGVGSLILPKLTRPTSISSLWNKLKQREEIGSFEKFILTLDFLFMCNLVEIEKGLIKKVAHD